MNRRCRRFLVPVAAAAVFALGACGSRQPVSAPVPGGNDIAGISAAASQSHATDQAYMKAHPLPPVKGMTAGIVISVTDLGDLCHETAQTTAYITPARGDDLCDAWTFTVLTRTGRTIRVSCGGFGRICPVGHIIMPGEEGEYVYVLSAGGPITSEDDVQDAGCYTPAGYPCPFGAQVYPPPAGGDS